MFDLEKSVTEWRKQMLAAGIQTESLEELENHLREEVEKQIKLGQKPEQSFEIAVEQVGRPTLLKAEFAKVHEIWPVWQKLKGAILGFNKIPTPSFQDFAPVGAHTLELAAGEARNFRHDFIGTEHILLGLLKSESTIVSKVMRRLEVEEKTVRIEIEKFFGLLPGKSIDATGSLNIPYTPRAKNALQLAGNEARALNQPQINPEHILLGLIREGDGVAWRALKNLGIQIEDARRELLVVMRENPGTT